MFIHYVNFWCKPGTPEPARQQLIEDCRTLLKKVPTVQQIWAGPPAMTARDVVDNSYDVGLCVIFTDAAGHDLYQTHALHEEFIDRNKAHWERVVVKDFLG